MRVLSLFWFFICLIPRGSGKLHQLTATDLAFFLHVNTSKTGKMYVVKPKNTAGLLLEALVILVGCL